MKKLYRYILPLFLTVLIGAIGWIISIPEFTDPWPVDATVNQYYLDTYEKNREAFHTACDKLKQTIPGTSSQAIPVPSKTTPDLTIDICRVPESSHPGLYAAPRLLIVTSGLHGSEGYVSSAVQRMLMLDLLAKRGERPEVLLIHSVNPYGMKYFRRVTENNVDLNRNFDTGEKLFQTRNPGYATLYPFLYPDEKAGLSSPGNRFFALRALLQIALKGMGTLRQAVLQGQYEFPDGIYFGGRAFEPQKALLEPILRREGSGKNLVVLVDLHTGYGERGRTHLFPDFPTDESMRKLTERLFDDYPINWPGGDFYSTTGDFSVYIGKVLPPGVRYVPMVFEFGTLDSQTMKGAIRSIQISILENQAAHRGCVTDEDCRQIRRDFREMFFPSSPSWRSKVMRDSIEIFTKTLDRIPKV